MTHGGQRRGRCEGEPACGGHSAPRRWGRSLGGGGGPKGQKRGQQQQGEQGAQARPEQCAGIGARWVQLPLLSMLLPDAGEEALQLLAVAAAQL